jgi:hypothetical protein
VVDEQGQDYARKDEKFYAESVMVPLESELF